MEAVAWTTRRVSSGSFSTLYYVTWALNENYLQTGWRAVFPLRSTSRSLLPSV